jgi:hypothetical protein
MTPLEVKGVDVDGRRAWYAELEGQGEAETWADEYA